MNSSEKQITVMARLSGQCFSGKPSIVVNPKCTEHYPLYFSPTWLGDYSGDLTLQIANSHEGNVYQLKGTAEEPLAEAHFVVQCTARESVVQVGARVRAPSVVSHRTSVATIILGIFANSDFKFFVFQSWGLMQVKVLVAGGPPAEQQVRDHKEVALLKRSLKAWVWVYF